MKNNLKTVLVVIALLSVPYVVRYAIDAVQTKEQVRQIEQRADDPNSKPLMDVAEGRKEWMSGCDDGTLNGANFNQTTYCGCAYDLMVQEKGLNWIANTGLNSTDAEMKEAFRPYSEQCVNQQNVESI